MFHTKRFGFVVGSGIEPLLRFRFWDAVFLGSKLKEYQEESNWWIYSTGTIYIYIAYMHAVYIILIKPKHDSFV